jgi:DNA-binding NtrC family response regulator
VLTILVVDDDPEQRSALADVLGDRHHVELATSADAALQRLTERPGSFDLVITDLWMPGRSGIDLRRALLQQGQLVPLVLMSSDRHVSQLAAGEGFYDCLAKPLSIDLVEALVARVAADKQRLVSADALPEVTTPGAVPLDTAPDDSDPEG